MARFWLKLGCSERWLVSLAAKHLTIKRSRMKSIGMVWTEKAVKTLRSLWSKGVPAREIGERLGGVSRNAVIGKAHRLGLSKQVGEGEVDSPPVVIRTEDLTDKMCRWPIGHPGDPDFRFCGEARIPTRPYCGEHCVQAYRRRSEEAA